MAELEIIKELYELLERNNIIVPKKLIAEIISLLERADIMAELEIIKELYELLERNNIIVPKKLIAEIISLLEKAGV